jgi:RNA polymerase sigma-70 factor (ECF subfamily)
VKDPASQLEALYAEFGPTIYARCKQILRDPAAAEDAKQEVFFKIHGQLRAIADERHAIAWLYRAATNHCLNEIRNDRTRAAIIPTVPEAPGRDAEEQTLQRQLVIRLIRELPPELALTAWMYHVDDLDQAQIAEICGIARRTVITRLRKFADRARRFLRREQR